MNDDWPGLSTVLLAATLTLSGSQPRAPSPPDVEISLPQQPFLAENDALRQRLEMTSFDGSTTRRVSGKDILTNESLQEDLAWMTYDNIPEPYHGQVLSDLTTAYESEIQNTALPDSQYRDLPTPVRHANLLNRVKQATKQSDLTKHYDSVDDAVRAVGATIMTESFFEQDATYPSDTSMGAADVGYGQASPWTRSYLHEHGDFPSPNDSTWFDVDTQVDFILTWYETLHSRAENNAVAQAGYNTGIGPARSRSDQATSYYAMFHSRRQRYFNEPKSETWQWVLRQAGLRDTKPDDFQ